MLGIVTLASLLVATLAAGPEGWWAGARARGALDAAKGYLNGRSDINQVRLDRLTLALEKAEESLKALDHDDDHHVDHLEERIEQITGSTCKRRYFQCGGAVPQCISNLLVCDGSPDCDNGHDEDEDVCTTSVVTEGSSWSWKADWGNCVTAVTSTGKMLVTGTHRSKHFPSRISLDITVTTDDDEFDHDELDHAFTTDGFWSFANRKLVIWAGTPGFPATVCHFEHGNDRHCEGPLVKTDTFEKCGTITATRHN